MASSSFRWLVAALCLSHASSFGIADSFHLMQTAASSFGHIVPPAPHATLAHHAVLSHAHHHASTHHPNAAADLLSAYKNMLAHHPLPTKMATGATLAVAGDAIAQSRDADVVDYDTKRASSFAVFDMAYRAVQHYAFPLIVRHCDGRVLSGALASVPSLHHHFDQSYSAAMEQTLASQLVIVPLFYYPVFFALTAAVQGLDYDGAVIRARENFLPLMRRNLMFWIPVQFVQFAFVPEDLQIPFLSACGLAWTFILSVSAGSAKKAAESSARDEQIVDLIDEMTTASEEDVPGKIAFESKRGELGASPIR